LDLPCATSEERVVDAGSMDKGRRKSTPRYYALLCHFFLSFLVHAYNFEVKGGSYISYFFFHLVVYRPKQINMSEGDADKNSTFTRLANCLSFARMKGVNRNKR
jgi:myb proto-oncogene protein